MNTIKGWVNKAYSVQVDENITLEAILSLPARPRGMVLFAHGSGSSRFSPRNQFVAQVLYEAGFATLLIDLLTPYEDAQDQLTREFRFDITLLSKRVIEITQWLKINSYTANLKIGYFGASTGAAAALIAAAEAPTIVSAVVSRGGRPDLASPYLRRVLAPTLLIVGSLDIEVIALNRLALSQLKGDKQLEIVQGATHLFEEPGALERVAMLASGWFERYLEGA